MHIDTEFVIIPWNTINENRWNTKNTNKKENKIWNDIFYWRLFDIYFSTLT